jgi:catechol 2,3-dioxygenase-like lactoylglutathione lyase family enzyme
MLQVERLDHLVLTVSDIEQSVAFYTGVLGMKKQVFGQGRVALVFGQQKINLHPRDNDFDLVAGQVQSGSADLCFIVDKNVEQARDELQAFGIDIIAGPVVRTGACGEIRSIYFRDPDNNLIEVANYL